MDFFERSRRAAGKRLVEKSIGPVSGSKGCRIVQQRAMQRIVLREIVVESGGREVLVALLRRDVSKEPGVAVDAAVRESVQSEIRLHSRADRQLLQAVFTAGSAGTSHQTGAGIGRQHGSLH